MFPFKRTKVSPATEAAALAHEALGAFEAVVGKLTIAKTYLSDAISEAHALADHHEDQAAQHLTQAKAHAAEADQHAAVIAKHDVVIDRIKNLLGG